MCAHANAPDSLRPQERFTLLAVENIQSIAAHVEMVRANGRAWTGPQVLCLTRATKRPDLWRAQGDQRNVPVDRVRLIGRWRRGWLDALGTGTDRGAGGTGSAGVVDASVSEPVTARNTSLRATPQTGAETSAICHLPFREPERRRPHRAGVAPWSPSPMPARYGKGVVMVPSTLWARDRASPPVHSGSDGDEDDGDVAVVQHLERGAPEEELRKAAAAACADDQQIGRAVVRDLE